MSSYITAALLLAALLAAPISGAQAPNPNARSNGAVPAGARDPGDPNAAVPPARYTTAFERYRPNEAVDVGAWRQSNDAVGRAGGWRIYGREAIPESAASEPPANAARKPEAAPAAKPMHGHKH